jgi:hypothetical protein
MFTAHLLCLAHKNHLTMHGNVVKHGMNMLDNVDSIKLNIQRILVQTNLVNYTATSKQEANCVSTQSVEGALEEGDNLQC